MEEVWKDIKGYEGLYKVSNYGNVMSINYRLSGKEKQLRLGILPIGYPVVVLCKDKVQTTQYVHRLVAAAFLDNPEHKPEVNHIDGCKANNNVENLEWATYSENQKHACRTGLADVEHAWRKSIEKSSVPVAKLDMDGNIICIYPSTSQAGKANHIGHSTVMSCAKGERDTAGGYKWAFAKREA